MQSLQNRFLKAVATDKVHITNGGLKVGGGEASLKRRPFVNVIILSQP